MSLHRSFFRNSTGKIQLPAILAISFIVSVCGACKKSQPVFSAKPQVEVLEIKPQRVVLTSELPGRTAAYRVAGITPRVSGLVVKRLFREGANVRAGSLLYKIDPAPFEAALESSRASLARAEANLTALKLRSDRLKELLPDKAVSQQEYDDALSAVKQIEAEILSIKAQIKTAKINLSYTRIKAPISGRIGRSSVTEGAVVTAYQTTPLSTIQQLNPVYVDVPQSTSELLRLKKLAKDGAVKRHVQGIRKVALILDDGSAYPYQGTLQFRDVTVDRSTGSVILRIVFPNPSGDLLPNMFVRVKVKEGVRNKALLVPQLAVARDSKGDPYTFIVDKNDKVEQKALKVDRSIGDKWLVLSGIKSGDRVIVSGIQKIAPGMTVQVMAPKGIDSESIEFKGKASVSGKSKSK